MNSSEKLAFELVLRPIANLMDRLDGVTSAHYYALDQEGYSPIEINSFIMSITSTILMNLVNRVEEEHQPKFIEALQEIINELPEAIKEAEKEAAEQEAAEKEEEHKNPPPPTHPEGGHA